MSLMIAGDILAVTGLDWDTTTPGEWKKQKKESRAQGFVCASFQVSDPRSGETVINFGTIPRDASLLSGNNPKASLAGLLALSITDKNIVALERLPSEGDDSDEEAYWFCAINNGQVITGTDVVGTYEQIQPLIQEHRELFDDKSIVVIGNAADQEDMDASTDSIEQYLDVSLVGGAMVVGKKTPKALLWVALGAVVVLVACAAIATMLLGGNEPKRPEMTTDEIIAQQQEIARSQLREKEQEVLSEADFINTTGSLMKEVIHNLTAKAGGWELTHTRCDSNACISKYRNIDLTPPSVLESASKESCNSLIVDTRGENATCVTVYQASTLRDVVGNNGWKLTANDQRALLDSLMDIARAFPGDAAYKIGEPQPVAFPGREALTPDELFGQGAFTVQVRSDLTELISQKIFSAKPLIVDNVELSWAEDVTQIEGRFITTGETE